MPGHGSHVIRVGMVKMSDAGNWLDRQTFSTVIAATPLVSIDLIVRNSLGQVLLGQRLNRPAAGFWFVPGGRILKQESLAQAFYRLTLAELGTPVAIEQARFIGLFEHFYDDSVFGEQMTTHYVVNAFEMVLPDNSAQLPVLQHSAYRWLSESELLDDAQVHLHSKWYFDSEKGYRT